MNALKNQDKLRQLCSRLQDEYRAVESLIGEIKQNRDGDLDVESLKRIRDRLNTIKQIEAVFAPLRDDVMKNGGNPPPELRTIVQETIKIITRLIPDISAIEKAALESRNRLEPRIHDAVRGLQMQHAYKRTTTS